MSDLLLRRWMCTKGHVVLSVLELKDQPKQYAPPTTCTEDGCNLPVAERVPQDGPA